MNSNIGGLTQYGNTPRDVQDYPALGEICTFQHKFYFLGKHSSMTASNVAKNRKTACPNPSSQITGKVSNDQCAF